MGRPKNSAIRASPLIALMSSRLFTMPFCCVSQLSKIVRSRVLSTFCAFSALEVGAVPGRSANCDSRGLRASHESYHRAIEPPTARMPGVSCPSPPLPAHPVAALRCFQLVFSRVLRRKSLTPTLIQLENSSESLSSRFCMETRNCGFRYHESIGALFFGRPPPIETL